MLTNFCGFRLNTLGVVIGWLGTIFSMIGVVIWALALGNVSSITDAVVKNNPDVSPDTIERAIIIVGSIYLVLIAINLIASIMLIVGTMKERHLMLLPWLINSGISLLFNFIYYIAVLINFINVGAPLGSILFTMIISGLFWGIHYMIWYAIYSLYKGIQAMREQQRVLLDHGKGNYPKYSNI